MLRDILCKKNERRYKIFLFMFLSSISNNLFLICAPGTTNSLSINANQSITGNLAVGGTLSSVGGFSVNGNNFTVDGFGDTFIAGATTLVGNTIEHGTLTVTGSASHMNAVGLASTLNVAGATTLNSVAVASTLNVAGATTITGNVIEHGTLTVTGSTSHINAVGLATTLNVAGATTLNSLAVTNNATIGGTLGVTGNTVVGGTLDVAGSLGAGWHHIFGEKSLTSIGTTATPVLTITFANLAGSTNPLYKGVRINLHVAIAGSVTIFTAANSVNYYFGQLIVSPGATATTACTLVPCSESSTNAAGNPITVTSSITGNGTAATLNLTASLAVTSPSLALFYEIMGDNVTSVS